MRSSSRLGTTKIIQRCFSTTNSSVHHTHPSIPIVDIKTLIPALKNETIPSKETLHICNAIGEAFCKVGFVYIKNSQVTESLITRAFSSTNWLFELTNENKSKFHTTENNVKGYYDYQGVENREKSNIEAWLMGNESTVSGRRNYFEKKGIKDADWINSSLNGRNQWPKLSGNARESEVFQKTMLEYYESCFSASITILQAIALYLNFPRDYFSTHHSNNDNTMELKRYLPLPKIEPKTIKLGGTKLSLDSHLFDKKSENQSTFVVRVNEHSDLSSVTLLVRERNELQEKSGLEIQNLNNEWISAPSLSDTILVNTGNVLERWTNGKLLSTPHRVVTYNNSSTQQSPLHSVVFFCQPNWDARITPLIGDKLQPSKVNDSFLFGDLIPYL